MKLKESPQLHASVKSFGAPSKKSINAVVFMDATRVLECVKQCETTHRWKIGSISPPLLATTSLQ